jgi:hypothetical protein
LGNRIAGNTALARGNGRHDEPGSNAVTAHMGSIRKLPDNRTPRVTNAENAARARLQERAEQPIMLDA